MEEAADEPVAGDVDAAGPDVLEPGAEVTADGVVAGPVDDGSDDAGAGSVVRDGCAAGVYGRACGRCAGTRGRAAAPGCGTTSAAGARLGDDTAAGLADGLADGGDDGPAGSVGIGSPANGLPGIGLGVSAPVSGPDIAAAAGMKLAAAPPPASSTPAVVTDTKSARRRGLRCLPTGMSIPP